MTVRKVKPMVSKCVDCRDNEFHYYASSVSSWATSTDLAELIRTMESEGYPFNLYKVNVSEKTEYDIRHTAPYFDEDDKCVWIGFFDVKEN